MSRAPEPGTKAPAESKRMRRVTTGNWDKAKASKPPEPGYDEPVTMKGGARRSEKRKIETHTIYKVQDNKKTGVYGGKLGKDTPPEIAEIAPDKHSETYVTKICPDSGATISLCSKKLADKMKLNIDTKKQVKLKDVQGKVLRCLGVAKAYIRAPCGPNVPLKLVITDAIPASQLLVSWNIQVKMDILPEDYPNVMNKGIDPKKFKKQHKRVVEKLMDRMMEEVIEQEEVRAVRTNEEEAPFPAAWPADIKIVLDKYTPSVLTDELTEERRITGPDMVIHFTTRELGGR